MMTYGECWAQVESMLPHGSGSLELRSSRWAPDKAVTVTWKLWVPTRSKWIEANTPDRLVELLADLLASKVSDEPMTPGEVAA